MVYVNFRCVDGVEVMKILPALITLLLATALTSRANVITQTIDFGSYSGSSQHSINQFNTALGTLTEVGLVWTLNSSVSSAQITNTGSSSVNISLIDFQSIYEATIPGVPIGFRFGSGATEFLSGGSGTLNPGQTYDAAPITLSTGGGGEWFYSSSSDFGTYTNAYLGTGTVPLYLSTSFTATPYMLVTTYNQAKNVWGTHNNPLPSYNSSITGSASGNLQVTYTYNAVAPVPEPPALLLGFGGLLGMAGLAFKRRTPRQAAAQA
jgi:hypothetical protein